MSKFIGATQTATLEDKITTFTSSGTFTPVKSAVDFLVVAGGGGASSKGAGSGGGGGGGFRASWNNETSGGLGDSESTLSLTAGTDYTVIVGAGGAGSSTSSAGTKGTNSYISEQFLANDSDTEFLLHSNTTNGSTTFTDSSSAGQTITAYGNVQHSTTEQKFGTTAIKFDGSGDYLTVPSIPNFGNYSQYCIEMWINTSASSGWLLFNAPNDQGMRLSIGKNGTATDSPGKVCMNEQNNNTDHYIISTSRVDDGEWHHLAVTRGTQNQPVKLYIDGVHETTGTVANWNFDSGETLYIGRRSNNAGSEFTGYLEEIRISDDTNRYSANFVPTGTPHIECIGGGSGGGQGGAGTTGGSGGGGAYTGAGYAGTANQGFTGGTAIYFGSSEYTGGAGGGAGGVGVPCVDLSPGVSGEGGPGQFTTITGRKIYYAGGGGGGSYIYGGPGARSATGGGGYGLGGDWFQGGSSRPHAYYGGTDKNGESAAANTGGGGGGGDGATNSDPSSGGAGGSGIVIAREADVNTITSGMWDMKQIYKEKLAGNWI